MGRWACGACCVKMGRQPQSGQGGGGWHAHTGEDPCGNPPAGLLMLWEEPQTQERGSQAAQGAGAWEMLGQSSILYLSL